MLLYLDTSALVKLYVREQGSATVARAVGRAEAVISSVVGYAELRSALARLGREGRLSPIQIERSRAAFEEDWARLVLLDVSERLARWAGELAHAHVLRGFDAIHIACALQAERLMGRPVHFLSFDRRQQTAAEQLGLAAYRD